MPRWRPTPGGRGEPGARDGEGSWAGTPSGAPPSPWRTGRLLGLRTRPKHRGVGRSAAGGEEI